MLCDWLVVNQVLPVNPAAAGRGPKHVVTKGSTPVLSPAEARNLLDSIDTGSPGRAPGPGALLGDALQLRAGERGPGDETGGLRGCEKGGKRHDVPAHHRAAEALDEYLDACGLEAAGEPLFESVDRSGGEVDRAGADPAGGAGHDQAPGVGGGASARDVLTHVPGDGDHGVSVERRDPHHGIKATWCVDRRGLPSHPNHPGGVLPIAPAAGGSRACPRECRFGRDRIAVRFGSTKEAVGRAKPSWF